jgi:hypothetical protein
MRKERGEKNESFTVLLKVECEQDNRRIQPHKSQREDRLIVPEKEGACSLLLFVLDAAPRVRSKSIAADFKLCFEFAAPHLSILLILGLKFSGSRRKVISICRKNWFIPSSSP